MNASDRQRLRDIEDLQITLYRRLAATPDRFREISAQLISLRAQENEIRSRTDKVDFDKYAATFHARSAGCPRGPYKKKAESTPMRSAYFQKGRA